MTSKFYSAILAGTAVLAMTLGSTAAQAADASATARARVLRALTLTNNRPLDFGAVVPTAVAGTVDIDAAGARTCGGGIACSGTVSSARFAMTGSADEFVTIGSDASVTLTSGLNTMSATLAASGASTQLDTLGAGLFTVGGTLSVAANQAEGVYTGTFDVTADYQ